MKEARTHAFINPLGARGRTTSTDIQRLVTLDIQTSMLKFEDPTKPLNFILYIYVSCESLGAVLYQKNTREKDLLIPPAKSIQLILYFKKKGGGVRKMPTEPISEIPLQAQNNFIS